LGFNNVFKTNAVIFGENVLHETSKIIVQSVIDMIPRKSKSLPRTMFGKSDFI